MNKFVDGTYFLLAMALLVVLSTAYIVSILLFGIDADFHCQAAGSSYPYSIVSPFFEKVCTP